MGIARTISTVSVDGIYIQDFCLRMADLWFFYHVWRVYRPSSLRIAPHPLTFDVMSGIGPGPT